MTKKEEIARWVHNIMAKECHRQTLNPLVRQWDKASESQKEYDYKLAEGIMQRYLHLSGCCEAPLMVQFQDSQSGIPSCSQCNRLLSPDEV